MKIRLLAAGCVAAAFAIGLGLLLRSHVSTRDLASNSPSSVRDLTRAEDALPLVAVVSAVETPVRQPTAASPSPKIRRPVRRAAPAVAAATPAAISPEPSVAAPALVVTEPVAAPQVEGPVRSGAVQALEPGQVVAINPVGSGPSPGGIEDYGDRPRGGIRMVRGGSGGCATPVIDGSVGVAINRRMPVLQIGR